MSRYYIDKEDGHDIWLVMIHAPGRKPAWLSMFDTREAAEKNLTFWRKLYPRQGTSDG